MSATSAEIDRHAAFRAALLALAYPGRATPPALSGGGLSADGLAQLVFDAIYEPQDRADDIDVARAILRVGTLEASDLARLARGSEETPEDGATVVFAPAASNPRISVRLRGPGIDGRTEYALPLAHDALGARDAACAQEPLGIDLLIVDGSVIIGLPRTTRIEVAN